MKRREWTQKLIYAAVCLALTVIAPALIGRIPEIGRALSPMHIPVLLCGFLAGPFFGAVVGAIAPILNSLLTGMPPLFPVATAMAFELSAYGLFTGLLYYVFLKNQKSSIRIFVSLIASMLIGRIVWGIAMLVLLGVSGAGTFTWTAFLTGAFTGAIPAIVAHIILVPVIVAALKKANVLKD